MADSLKVPKKEFEDAIRALLNTPPVPMADITRKKQKKHEPKRK